MINTRIYNVLKGLEKPILNRFIKFIDSPYHNRSESVSHLTHLLIDTIKSSKVLPAKEKIWKKVQNNGPYDDLKFRKLCNDVLERFENFLVIEQLEASTLLKTNLLLDALKNHNLELIVEKHISKSSRQIDREADQSSEYYLQKYYYERSLQNLKTNYEKKENIKSYLSNYKYEDLSKDLDTFYVIEKLRHATDILTWRKMYKMDIEIDFGFTIELIEKYDLKQYPAVNIYLLMFKILNDEADSGSYLTLKKISIKFIDIFPIRERREILDVLLNYCLKQCNLGDISFYNELLEIYDWGIDSEILLENNILSPTSFRNYILSGLRIGEFNRVESFIHNKSLLLESSKRENAINFNLARLYFHKKNFDEALKSLSKVNYDDIWYHLSSRIQLLAIYYELDEINVLMTSIDSFSTFLRREKNVQNMRTNSYLNFTKFLKSMVNNKLRKDRLEKLKNEIVSEYNVVNKPWLLEKIDELL